MPSKTPGPAERRQRQYRFGAFTLDLDRGFLRHHGEAVDLRAKAFDLLAHLVEHHDRLVTKDELVDAVWPRVAVTDNSLAQCMADVRRALGDEGHGMIRTTSISVTGWLKKSSTRWHRFLD